MMGRKERAFAPLVAVSLEALVPQDHFYRHLDRILDLGMRRFRLRHLWRVNCEALMSRTFRVPAINAIPDEQWQDILDWYAWRARQPREMERSELV
jgi:hypothetical protein